MAFLFITLNLFLHSELPLCIYFLISLSLSQETEFLSSFTDPLCLPAGIYLFEVKNGNTGTMCEIYSKLTIKTPERRQ